MASRTIAARLGALAIGLVAATEGYRFRRWRRTHREPTMTLAHYLWAVENKL